MSASQRPFTGSLPALLCLLIFELGLYQVAVPAAAPKDPQEIPPSWHQVLEYVGLFAFYFASALALFVLIAQLAGLWTRRQYPLGARFPLALFGGAFAGLATVAIFTQAAPTTQFLFEASFTAALLSLILAQANRAGLLTSKLGLTLLATPFIVHFYGPIAAKLWDPLLADTAMPENLARLGQWTFATGAVVSPFLLGPRPLMREVAKPFPMAAAVTVCVLATFFISTSYEAAAELAAKGIGIDIGPGAPMSVIALYILALGAGVWTVVACLTSDNRWRRQVGLGVGIAFAAGYGFHWPVQYLAALVGLLVVSDAITYLGAQDDCEDVPFRSPPIPDAAWKGYLSATCAVLDGGARVDNDEVKGQWQGLAVTLWMNRDDGVLASLTIAFGGERPEGEPAFTMEAVPEKAPLGTHPPPPPSSAEAVKTGDAVFDRRFRLRDGSALSDKLLDEALRGRAAAVLDGWVAVWPGERVEYCVYPGRGAPVDSPVPVTELAFKTDADTADVERLSSVIAVIGEISKRTLAS